MTGWREITVNREREEGEKRSSSYRVSAHVIRVGSAPVDDHKGKGEVIMCDDGITYLCMQTKVLCCDHPGSCTQVLYMRPSGHSPLNSYQKASLSVRAIMRPSAP